MNSARTLVFVLLAAGASFAGCAMSRVDQLHSKADRVESSLRAEQRRVLALSESDPTRGARLDHLTQLRMTLSAANVGLGAVPHLVTPDKRDVAYDVLDETYDTIEWNIPLSPADRERPLPSRFNNGVMKLD